MTDLEADAIDDSDERKIQVLEDAIRRAAAADDGAAVQVLGAEYKRRKSILQEATMAAPSTAPEAPVGAPTPPAEAPAQPQGLMEQLGASFDAGISSTKTAADAVKARLTALGVDQARKMGNPELVQQQQERLGEGAEAVALGVQEGQTLFTHPAIKAMSEAKTAGEAWDAFMTAPLEVVANSIAQEAPQMAATVATALMLPGVAAVAGAAVVSGGTGAIKEFGSSLIGYARDKGVDTSNPQAVEDFYNNENLLYDASIYAAKRSGAIGVVDALGGALLPKTLVPKSVISLPARIATNVAAQTVAQGGLGALGEGAAQVLTGEHKPGDILLEGVAGSGMAAPAGLFTSKASESPASKSDVNPDEVLKKAKEGVTKEKPAPAVPVMPQYTTSDNVNADGQMELPGMDTTVPPAPPRPATVRPEFGEGGQRELFSRENLERVTEGNEARSMFGPAATSEVDPSGQRNLFSAPNARTVSEGNAVRQAAAEKTAAGMFRSPRDEAAIAEQQAQGQQQFDEQQQSLQGMFRGRDRIQAGPVDTSQGELDFSSRPTEQTATPSIDQQIVSLKRELESAPTEQKAGLRRQIKNAQARKRRDARNAEKQAALVQADASTGNATEAILSEEDLEDRPDRIITPQFRPIQRDPRPATQQDVTSHKTITGLVEKAQQQGGEHKSALVFYEELAKKLNNSPALKLITERVAATLQALSDAGHSVSIQILDSNTYSMGRSQTSRGQWVPNGQGQPTGFKIYLRDGFNPDTGMLDIRNGVHAITAIHEGIHGATAQIINAHRRGEIVSPALSKAIADLKDIQDDVNLANSDGSLNETKQNVWIKDIRELIAHGLTTPQFKMWLQNQNTSSPSISRRQPGTLWTRFKKAILGVLGITEDTPKSLYEAVLEVFDTLSQITIESAQDLKYAMSNFYQNLDDNVFDQITPESLKSLRELLTGEFVGFNALGTKVSPYGAFADLTDHLIVPENVQFAGVDETGLFSPQIPEANMQKDAPYVIIYTPTSQGRRNIVVNVPGEQAYLAVKAKFPESNIMTPAEGQAFLERGFSPEQVAERARAKQQAAAAAPAAQRIIGAKGGKLLEHFTDIDTFDEAKQLQLQEGDLAIGSNVTDYFVSGVNAKAVITNSPILRYIRGLVQGIVRAQSVMARKYVMPMGELWQKMTQGERETAMGLALLQDEQQRHFTPEELLSFGATPVIIDLLAKMKTALDVSLDEWNAHRQSVGLNPVAKREGYFPFVFEGDYRAVARDEKGGIIGVVTAGTKLGLEAKMKKIKEKFEGTTFDDLKRVDMARKNPMDNSMWDQYNMIARFLEDRGNTDTATEFAEYLETLAKEDARFVLGFQRHEKFKKGVFGALGNDPSKSREENTLDAFKGLVTYLEDGASHHAMIPVLDNMAKLINDPELRLNTPRTVLYLEGLYQHLSRRKAPSGEQSKVGMFARDIGSGIDQVIDGGLKAFGVGPTAFKTMESKMRALFSSFVMGMGNIAFTGLQLLQVPTIASSGASYLRDATGLGISSMRGRTAALKASMDVSRYFMDTMSNKYGKSPVEGFDWFGGDADTRAAMQYAQDNNLITLNDLELARSVYETPAGQRLELVMNINQRAAEAATRPYVFMWFYNILKDTNLPKEKQYEIARNATNFTMAEYHATARPMVYNALGTVGQVTGQLKTFAHSIAGQQYFWAKMGAKGQSIRPLMTMVVAYMLVMGMQNMPGADELEWLSRKASKEMYDDENVIGDFVARYLPEFLSMGLMSEFTGIDFQNRLRMPPLIQSEVLANAPSLNWLAQNIKPTIDWMLDPTDSAKATATAFAWAPSSVKGLLENMLFRDYSDNAMLSKDQRTRYTHRNDFDWKVRLWGLRSMEDTRRMENLRTGRSMEKEERDLKANIVDEVVRNFQVYGSMPASEYESYVLKYEELGGKRETLDNAVEAGVKRKAKGEELHFMSEGSNKTKKWFWMNQRQ